MMNKPQIQLDPNYIIKFRDLPKIISDWVSPYFKLEHKNILDFGCGDATTALGFATEFKSAKVCGVEVQENELNNCLLRAISNLGIQNLPSNLSLNKIEPGQNLMPFGRYDLVYAWSVFEHVDQGKLIDCLKSIHEIIKENGLFFIQIAPLFYSAFGSHLGAVIKEPWAHLRMPHNLLVDLLKIQCKDEGEYAELLNCYETLNKITANELSAALTESGFEILREYKTQVPGHFPDCRLISTYREDVLMTEQIVMLARPKS